MKTIYKTTILLAFISLAQLTYAGFVSNDIPNDLLKSRAVAMGDVNNDGNIDIYVGNRIEQNKLWLGNGDGTFTNSDISGDDTGNTTDVVMADFNSDGNLDIYVLEWYMKNKLWLGNGDGTFTNGNISTEPDEGSSAYGGVAVGDIDNDGDIDIYNVPYGASTQNTLWLNDGNANFTLGTTIPLDGVAVYYDVVMTDLDADGNLDIYQTTRQYNKQNKLWMGNGDGTFTNNDITNDLCLDANGGCPGGSVSTGDIDNDGDIDLYLTAYYDYSSMNLNKFWINDGSANFSSQTITDDYGDTAQDSELVDIDNDGDLDILIAMYYNRQNIIWINDGNGNFTQDNIIGDTGYSFSLVVGDVNNDNELDIYIANGDYGIDDNKLWLQDTQAPIITLSGNDPETIEVGTMYTDAGASCTDNIDPTCSVTSGGTIDTSVIGTYTLTYDAIDSVGNIATQISRTVHVVNTDIVPPVITLNGNHTQTLYLNDTYTEDGAVCSDDNDSSCTVIITGNVDTTVEGSYIIYYDAQDISGNDALQITRTVIVKKKSSSSGSIKVSKATLKEIFGTSEDTTIDESLTISEIKPKIGEGKLCDAPHLLTQNLKAGARDGYYHSYTKEQVSEVKILQTHMNRLGFNSGVVDGILGPITDGAIKRMQITLGIFADGYVGPITRALINTSC
ncbi:archaellum component FlaG (FlaF/FlaG flagellin family) [Mesoflavibacter sabulilitoris]|uniref:Uncharacterized protein n=1 Tax=Mesoflavibacter zeaxanthinifaciens subsp. sabulilitoris TaxID=1520893 RepID=A0A2T1N666_9FLAO|nr:FG-GAP-like repeat-containing protein [Mesoflavibacter zeaxanthinifaciens]MBB3123281.1 archaellum component FlaG (FlaF/FlaG flagellin family) [Mesoflavibacter zeaxanthinifaciens subsp. sabulilitoris]PSG87082.1 hypothetical protein C7H61_13305 [Mesoflavibacter zeaxanthinifaciens subsp. sabulilitoris]